MGVPFKKIARKDPRKADAVAKFYPQLVTLGDNATLDDIAYVMKEKSSLTLGDIQSVLTNFVEAMITTLYSGQSVNIKNFGVFSLSARTAGVLDVKGDGEGGSSGGGSGSGDGGGSDGDQGENPLG